MRYIIKEIREVVLINNLPHIKKWKETFEVLEEGLSTQSSLKAGFEPDTLVRRDNGEILLLRDEDRGKDILNKEISYYRTSSQQILYQQIDKF
jgi:hypothetical protein